MSTPFPRINNFVNNSPRLQQLSKKAEAAPAADAAGSPATTTMATNVNTGKQSQVTRLDQNAVRVVVDGKPLTFMKGVPEGTGGQYFPNVYWLLDGNGKLSSSFNIIYPGGTDAVYNGKDGNNQPLQNQIKLANPV